MEISYLSSFKSDPDVLKTQNDSLKFNTYIGVRKIISTSSKELLMKEEFSIAFNSIENAFNITLPSKEIKYYINRINIKNFKRNNLDWDILFYMIRQRQNEFSGMEIPKNKTFEYPLVYNMSTKFHLFDINTRNGEVAFSFSSMGDEANYVKITNDYGFTDLSYNGDGSFKGMQIINPKIAIKSSGLYMDMIEKCEIYLAK